jgi:ubiquinol-cytochrome c reductase cytochrome c1 subunit
MVRILAFLAGLGFVTALFFAAVMPRDKTEVTAAQRFHRESKEISFASDGPLGKFDKAQLQRGFQVYKEVCSACHSMRLLRFSDLEAIGYTPGQIKTIAIEWSAPQPSLNAETGETATRKNVPADHFPSPYANEIAGRAANNGALPPDMSLLSKAREGGGAYIYSILTGYQAVPANLPTDARPDATHYYNPYFASLNIAMPQPLATDGQVTYGQGGPKPTVKHMAKDVAAFLIWTAEPKLEARHRAGMATLIYLLIFAGLCWFSYKSIWADKKH